MNAINTAITNNAGTLAQSLQSAVFIKMEDTKGKSVSSGHRWCKLIKKGENSKLAHSLAVEIPMLTGASLAAALNYPSISEYLLSSLEQLQAGYIKSRAEIGATGIQYSELSMDKLAEFAAQDNASNGIGQISEERIKHWFDAELRDLWIVALANKLGIAEDATQDDVNRLEQIANQTRDNLAKLSSKKPVTFDARVKNALNAALSCALDEDTFAPRLVAKLNVAVNDNDMLASLGM